jgi:hypothetical protein
MIIPAPRAPRDLFNLFLRYETGAAPASLLEGLGYAGVSRRELYYAILGRLPNAEVIAGNPEQSPQTFASKLLLGDEFQKRVIRLALNAFPEKRRLIFIHIPKSAGANLTASLRPRYPSLPHTMDDPAWTPHPRLFQILKRFVTDAHWSDTVYVHGHNTLQWCINNQLIRAGDRVITILRDPQSTLISQVNYILTRMLEDPGGSKPDVRGWRRTFDLAELDPTMPLDQFVQLAKRILHAAPAGWANRTCHFLGQGDMDSALRNLLTYDVEVTTLTRYDEWLAVAWGVNTEKQHINESRKFLTKDMLDKRDLARIRELTESDQRLYDLVSARVDASSTPSITGVTLMGHVRRLVNAPRGAGAGVAVGSVADPAEGKSAA